jgi:hypothetical protein
MTVFHACALVGSTVASTFYQYIAHSEDCAHSFGIADGYYCH